MQNYSYTKKLFTVALLLSALQINADVNPQSGQNLWHITAAIGTEVDQLALNTSECCAATFTALDNISSKVDNLALCELKPLTIPAGGTNIATSGAYCLTGDASITGGVTISASDVVLDLNDHTITGIGAITDLTISNNRVTVHNGNIRNGATGISVGAFSNVYIHDVSITGCTGNGLAATSPSDLLLEHVSVGACGGKGYAISANTPQRCIALRRCIGNNNASHGFDISYVTALIEECFACNNSGNGFYVNAPGTTGVSTNVCLSGCVGKLNLLHGFEFNAATTDGVRYIADACESHGNVNNGYEFSGGTTVRGIIRNSKALNNATIGFDFVTTTSGNIIERCTANQHSKGGFNNNKVPAGNNSFVLNTAAYNTPNYSGVPNVSTLGSTTPGYGDNISAP